MAGDRTTPRESTSDLPAFVRALRAVRDLEGLSVYEKSALCAAVQWVNFETGSLWPSKAEWAAASGMSERQLFKVLRDLSEKGLARTVTASKGGRGRASEWCLPALAVDAKPGTDRAGFTSAAEEAKPGTADRKPGTETRHGAERNPAQQVSKPGTVGANPARQDTNPAQLVRTNYQEQPRNSQNERASSRASEGGGEPTGGAEKTPHPAARFLADREARTGNAPPGFARFWAEYPSGHATDRGGLLALWRALGLEDDSGAVLTGLAAWKGSERWREGYVVKARKFIDERLWETPPPAPKAKPQALGGAW